MVDAADAIGSSRPITVEGGDGSVCAWPGPAWPGPARDADPTSIVGVRLRSPRVRVGVGVTHDGADGFRRSHPEARDAERIAHGRRGPVVLHAAVPLSTLAAHDLERAAWFVADQLGPLAAIGAGPAELRTTLATYLHERLRLATAADRLHVHRNTLVQRLHRIEQLLGRSERLHAQEHLAPVDALRDPDVVTEAAESDGTHEHLGVAEFRTTAGVEDWRVLGDGARVRYRCGSIQAAARFAAGVAEAVPIGPRQPDIDLRPGSVTVRIPEFGQESFLLRSDLPLAQAIQRIAREQGLEPDPRALRSFQLAVAHAPGVPVQAFWEAVLGYVPINPTDSRDPHEQGPRVWFHPIEHGRAGRGRTHFDVYVPRDEAEAIVEAALRAGGRIADDSRAPEWWTLASPDNHGVDVAPWPDRG